MEYSSLLNEFRKKLKYTNSFINKGMVHLNLQLLYKCNFKCEICDFWKKEEFLNAPMLTLDNIKTISEKIKPLGPQIISIGGGEPLLHKDITEITRVLSVNNFPVMICNGWFVTKEFSKALFDAGMYEVSISIDYADPKKHDKQRGVEGAWEKAVNALKILNENRTRPYQRVHMISVVMDDNLEEIEKLIHLSKDLGVSYLVTLYSTGRGKKENKASRKDITAHLLDLKKKYKHFVAIPGYLERFSEASENDNGIFPCYAGKNLFNIDSQGNVTRCIDTLEFSAGNILKDDLPNIMDNLEKQYESNHCGGCWTSCRGSVESLMYGKNKLRNVIDSYHMTRSVKLGRPF